MAKAHTLFDNFNDNSISGAKWNVFEDGGVTVTETNQRIEIAIPNPGALGDYAELSGDTYDFEDSYVFCQIVQSPNTSSDAVAAMQVSFTAGNAVWIQVEHNIIYIYRQVASVNTLITSFAYNSSTHAWWRIREGTVDGGSSGTIYFDTSEDGINWTNRASYAHSYTLSACTPFMYALCYKAETAPGTFIFDNFNLVPHTHGTETFDGEGDISSASPLHTHFAEVEFDGDSDILGLSHSVEIDLTQGKSYEYKIFQDGNYITSWRDVISDFKYNQPINSAGNGITVELARTPDVLIPQVEELHTEGDEVITTEDDENLEAIINTGAGQGAGTDVDLNLDIEVWVYYGFEDVLVDELGEEVVDENAEEVAAVVGAPEGQCLFRGYISSFFSRYGQNETVQVYCLPYGAELDNYIIHSGDDTNVNFFSYDPADIVRSILDTYGLDGGSVGYGTSSVQNAGTAVTYRFKLNTVLEGLQKAHQMAPSDYWWAGNVGRNEIDFKPTPATPAHTFILGKHIKDLNLEKTIEGLINTFYFLGGDQDGDPETSDILFKKYTDQDSINNYRPGLDRQTDQRVTDPDSADIIGGSEIERQKDPRYRGTVTILDQGSTLARESGVLGYEIETIELGQLVSFKNFNNFIDNLQLQIVNIDYTPDAITLQLDTLLPMPNKRLEDIKRNLNREEQIDVPTTAT